MVHYIVLAVTKDAALTFVRQRNNGKLKTATQQMRLTMKMMMSMVKRVLSKVSTVSTTCIIIIKHNTQHVLFSLGIQSYACYLGAIQDQTTLWEETIDDDEATEADAAAHQLS